LLRELNILGKFWFVAKNLPFDMQAQTQSNWCWAATATSVSHFYWLFSHWTQCSVANAELGRGDCCSGTAPGPCNVPWYLDRALTRTNNFVNIIGPATFAQVRAEIDAGRPVGARIGWSGGGGHFMVIYGYSKFAGIDYFDIDDPIYGKSHLAVADFTSNYQGSGSWTHTYFTKSYFRMPIRFLYPKEPILRRIWEARGLLRAKQDFTFDGGVSAKDAEVGVGLAHRIYTLGLDALIAPDVAAPQPAALRIYDVVGESPQAFYDISDDAEPRILQMSAARNVLEPFSRALEPLLKIAEAADIDYELRLLRVPALNFEALWLAPDDAPQGTLVALRSVGNIQVDQVLTYDELIRDLSQAAKVLSNMDDEMGA
jgi:hypothetical protein